MKSIFSCNDIVSIIGIMSSCDVGDVIEVYDGSSRIRFVALLGNDVEVSCVGSFDVYVIDDTGSLIRVGNSVFEEMADSSLLPDLLSYWFSFASSLKYM